MVLWHRKTSTWVCLVVWSLHQLLIGIHPSSSSSTLPPVSLSLTTGCLPHTGLLPQQRSQPVDKIIHCVEAIVGCCPPVVDLSYMRLKWHRPYCPCVCVINPMLGQFHQNLKIQNLNITWLFTTTSPIIRENAPKLYKNSWIWCKATTRFEFH